jgi:hypothetical protein
LTRQQTHKQQIQVTPLQVFAWQHKPSCSSSVQLTSSCRPYWSASQTAKAPALLSLLLSCLKRLQQQVGHNAAVTADVDRTRVAWMSFAMASVQTAAMLVSTAVAGHSLPQDTHLAAAAACSLAGESSRNKDRKSGSCDSRTASKGRAADQPSASPCTEPAVISSIWLLLAGRALYTTGVTLQAALLLGDSSSSSGTTSGTPGQRQQVFAPEQQQQQAPDSTASLPQLWVPFLKESILLLGRTVQDLAAPDGTAVQGSKQLRVVLGSPVLEAHAQLASACAAAAGSVCTAQPEVLADEPAAEAGVGVGHVSCGAASHKQPADVAAWQQLRSTGAGKALAESLLSFGSLLCAALPTRFCCNEPSCCCLDKPSELHLAVGKSSKCSACGTARYCVAVDQSKHWKQHKPVCKAVAAAAKATAARQAKKGAKKDKAAQKPQ